MTAARRLAKLESSLSPRAATLLWLTEAHRFPTLPAYVGWLIDQPISAAPLERVPKQARAAAVEALRSQPREVVQEAAHQAVRDAIFLVELVLRLNAAAEVAIRIENLRYAALFWEMRALTAEAELALRSRSRADRSGSSLVERWQEWCTATAARLAGIHAAEDARDILERRYLGGHGALFPDTIADWERLRKTAERLASVGDALRLPKMGRRRAPRTAHVEPPVDLAALAASARTQAPIAAAQLIDAARAATLDVLGDVEGASSIAAQRLRATPTDTRPRVSVT